ncbi:Glutamate decarboxylase [Thalictrum thalictroides]|uniref:glutamate decarboxylase n=1 Tax=Thalictrum thalictroides TaxID=46969 RepID=A0A7J6X8C9_THATH|nr:Glutamate decarboxylase [Thalictrum thalictroides]
MQLFQLSSLCCYWADQKKEAEENGCHNSNFRYKLPENSIPKEAAYQIISDELMLDGNPRLDLASFVTTWMEPEVDKLMMDSINKNYVDMDVYPVTTELQVSSMLRLGKIGLQLELEL